MKLVVMLPAFNEGESIANVVAGIPRKLNGIGSAEILIVDDGSVDDTVEQARAAGADKVVSHGTNQGLV